MTRNPQSVLVPVDFGEASARAVAFGGAIAAERGATLRLLHSESIEAPPYFTAEQIDALERQRHAIRAQAEQFVSRFGRRHTRAPFSVLVDDRPPVDAILKASLTADLVVMGTHGRHGITRWWLGSVAERVLRAIDKPLLIVHADTPLPDGPVDATRLIIPVPHPRTAAWLSQYGEPLVRSSRVPILFVPEIPEGVSV